MQSNGFPQPVSGRWFLNWWLGFDFMSFNSIYTSSSTRPGKLLHISLSLHVFPVGLGEIMVSFSCYWRDFRSLEHGAVGQRTSRAWNQRLGAAVARDAGRRAGKGLALPRNEGFHRICHGLAMICHSWWPWHQGKNDRRTNISTNLVIEWGTWFWEGCSDYSWFLFVWTVEQFPLSGSGPPTLLGWFSCLPLDGLRGWKHHETSDHVRCQRCHEPSRPLGSDFLRPMQISRPQSFRWWTIVIIVIWNSKFTIMFNRFEWYWHVCKFGNHMKPHIHLLKQFDMGSTHESRSCSYSIL